MATALYSLKIKNKRDVLLARQRARQLTRLLGYAEAEQLLLASAAFELAWTTYQSRGRVALRTLKKRMPAYLLPGERKEEEEERCCCFKSRWNGGKKPPKPSTGRQMPSPNWPYAWKPAAGVPTRCPSKMLRWSMGNSPEADAALALRRDPAVRSSNCSASPAARTRATGRAGIAPPLAEASVGNEPQRRTQRTQRATRFALWAFLCVLCASVVRLQITWRARVPQPRGAPPASGTCPGRPAAMRSA